VFQSGQLIQLFRSFAISSILFVAGSLNRNRGINSHREIRRHLLCDPLSVDVAFRALCLQHDLRLAARLRAGRPRSQNLSFMKASDFLFASQVLRYL